MALLSQMPLTRVTVQGRAVGAVPRLLAGLTVDVRPSGSLVAAERQEFTRSFNEPNRFDGAKDAWTDWTLVLMSGIQTVSPHLKNGMGHASTSDVAWNACVTDPNLVKESERLHYMPAQLLGGVNFLDMVLEKGDGEGLKAWRHLTLEFDPRSADTVYLEQFDELIRVGEEDW